MPSGLLYASVRPEHVMMSRTRRSGRRGRGPLRGGLRKPVRCCIFRSGDKNELIAAIRGRDSAAGVRYTSMWRRKSCICLTLGRREIARLPGDGPIRAQEKAGGAENWKR
ncbi:MAG: hypothetical protein ACLR8P_04660 [Clostridium fessum]